MQFTAEPLPHLNVSIILNMKKKKTYYIAIQPVSLWVYAGWTYAKFLLVHLTYKLIKWIQFAYS